MATSHTEPPAVVPEPAAIQYFFESLYGGAHDGYLVLSYPDPMQLLPNGTHPFASRWYDLADSSWPPIAQEAANASAQANLYFGVALQSPACKPHRGKRSQTATAYCVHALWADLDLAYGKHQASALPQSDEELLDFLHALPALPSLIVHSGGGMYPFWLLAKPLIIANPDEHRAVQHLCDRFGRTLLELGKQRGWTLDVVSDLPRILRPPGTINHKYGKLVELIHASELRYAPSDFEGWLVDVPPRSPRVPRDSSEEVTDLPDIKSVAEHYGAEFTRETTDELSGAHPLHGSSTGGNFSVNTAEQVWHCWRHGTGGGVLQLVAVCEGLLACEEARPGCLQGNRFVDVVKRTNDLFGTSIPLRPMDAAEYARQQQVAADDRITERMAQAHVYSNGHRPHATGGPQVQDETEEVPYVAKPWPECHPAAFYGIAGEIVKAIEPHTESDPVSLLAQLLAMAGNAIGRTGHFPVEADRHFANLFICMVGQTSKARKGTSSRYPMRLLREADPAWAQRLASGMSSGEGIIWAVRDPVYGIDPKTKQPTMLDAGVSDKRLFILESEFARALKKTGDSGNTLSAVLRQAWDEGTLRTLVSGRHKAPVHATNAHISIVAHITAEELTGLLSQTDAFNGFCNRFLWLCVRRARLLPDGGLYPEQALAPLRERLGQAIVNAQRVARAMKRSQAAQDLWREIYTTLAEGKPGVLGAVTARAEAQALRLLCLYALLDSSSTVEVDHLRAALALWDYCEASARYLFADELGDRLAASLLLELREAGAQGLSRAKIRDLLGRHVLSAAIGKALEKLHELGLARCEIRKTPGRSKTTWYATPPAPTPSGGAYRALTAHLPRNQVSQNGGLDTSGDELTALTALTAQPPPGAPSPEDPYEEGII